MKDVIITEPWALINVNSFFKKKRVHPPSSKHDYIAHENKEPAQCLVCYKFIVVLKMMTVKKKGGKLNKDLLQVAFVASGGVRDADG